MSWCLAFPGGIVLTLPGRRWIVHPFAIDRDSLRFEDASPKPPPRPSKRPAPKAPKPKSPPRPIRKKVPVGADLSLLRLHHGLDDPLPYTRPVTGWYHDPPTPEVAARLDAIGPSWRLRPDARSASPRTD